MTLKVGDTINIDEKHHETLDTLMSEMEDAEAAFRAASRMMRQSQEKLWEYIREAVPDSNHVDFRYDNENKELVAMENFDARLMKLQKELDLSDGQN